MAKWKRGHGRRRSYAASIYFYTDRAPEATTATPDPYTHDDPDAIRAGLMQMEVGAAEAEQPLVIPEGDAE